jgi:hypothetical protein
MSIYLPNPWKPAPYSIIKDKELTQTIESKGFSIKNTLTTEIINQLRQLYSEHHQIENDKGGMFYSIYSQDTDYRKKIHKQIGAILQPIVEQYFRDYKMVLNSFVVKVSGPKSEFYLHQDTTGLDEWKYSPLSLWIPLQDVDETNGCLGAIPYSQHFFTPYRSISFPAPFDNIQSTVKQYLQPLDMKAGEMMIFDNRMLHHSYSNLSGKDRIAVICGLFPKEAKMITCHKPEYVCGGKVELIEHDDDFLLRGKNFLIDCQKRPETGESIGWVEDPFPEITAAEFETLCEKYGLKKTSEKIFENTECTMIGEPNLPGTEAGNKKSILSKLKQMIALK